MKFGSSASTERYNRWGILEYKGQNLQMEGEECKQVPRFPLEDPFIMEYRCGENLGHLVQPYFKKKRKQISEP